MSDHNLNTTNLTATGTAYAGRVRIRAIYNGSTGGTVTLRDGGAGGTVKFTLVMAAGQTCDLPGSIEFKTDCHATLATTTSVTLVY